MTESPFKPGSASGEALQDWWRDLQETPGERAELRRAATLNQVVFAVAYHRLRFAVMPHVGVRDKALIAIAGLSARVKERCATPIARQMGEWTNGRPRVSELRFKRLLAAEDRIEWFPLMRRTLALLGDTADLHSLAQAAWWWNDHTRQGWAKDYYLAAILQSQTEIEGETQ